MNRKMCVPRTIVIMAALVQCLWTSSAYASGWQVENLQKSYGSLKAVHDVSFEVYAGEIFGMVGPNGAGKTTTIEIIEGLRKADSGQVRVLGLNPALEGGKLFERVGIQLQQSGIHPRLKVMEALELFASFYQHPAKAGDLLERLGLADKSNSPFSKLSGGQKQRVQVDAALWNPAFTQFEYRSAEKE